MKIEFSCKSSIFILQSSIFILVSASTTHSLAFPDTADLKKTHKVSARSPDGKPTLFSRKHKGDSLSLVLEWEGRRPVAARHIAAADRIDRAIRAADTPVNFHP
ncbi:MAG TPA: hypothetical protein VK465_09795, partial [Fibrobacteria bacterium]|nr:hypothetical protein [Fibrobacteria bacterium]